MSNLGIGFDRGSDAESSCACFIPTPEFDSRIGHHVAELNCKRRVTGSNCGHHVTDSRCACTFPDGMATPASLSFQYITCFQICERHTSCSVQKSNLQFDKLKLTKEAATCVPVVPPSRKSMSEPLLPQDVALRHEKVDQDCYFPRQAYVLLPKLPAFPVSHIPDDWNRRSLH